MPQRINSLRTSCSNAKLLELMSESGDITRIGRKRLGIFSARFSLGQPSPTIIQGRSILREVFSCEKRSGECTEFLHLLLQYFHVFKFSGKDASKHLEGVNFDENFDEDAMRCFRLVDPICSLI
uniref:Uncharacterized protein n=1 Tax=Ditylenchus dipsaci TaxID=166011 RepID=A0A915D8S2_9BILA